MKKRNIGKILNEKKNMKKKKFADNLHRKGKYGKII